MESLQDNFQNIDEGNVLEKFNEKSTFRQITQVLILDSFISLWNSLKEILSVFKFYLTFGLLPNRKQITFEKHLQFSKKIIGIYFVLAVFKIVLLELLEDSINITNFLQYIAEFFILVVYYLGIVIFCLLGKLIAFICYRKHDKRTIEAYMLGEFNFLFLLYYFLIFLGILNNAINNTYGWIGSLSRFCLFCWIHSFYSYFIVFRKNKSFIRFKRTLIFVPITISIVMFFILGFFIIFDSLKFLQISN